MTTATLVAIAKDEEKYIVEWIAYHLSIGFDKIIIYDNESRDDMAKIVRHIADHESRVDIISWPSVSGRSPQISAYTHALQFLSTSWVAFLDIDEFLVPFLDGNIKLFLNRVPDNISSVHVNWLGFGSGGIIDSDYEFVIKSFLYSSFVHWGNNHHFKSLARVEHISDVHIHDIKTSAGRRVLSDFHSFETINGGLSNRIIHDGIQINHYQCKSYPEFEARMKRGDANYPPDHPSKSRDSSMERFKQLDLNEEKNTKIGRFYGSFDREHSRIVEKLRNSSR